MKISKLNKSVPIERVDMESLPTADGQFTRYALETPFQAQFKSTRPLREPRRSHPEYSVVYHPLLCAQIYTLATCLRAAYSVQ